MAIRRFLSPSAQQRIDEHIPEQHFGAVPHQSTTSYKFVRRRRMGMWPHRDSLPARLIQRSKCQIDCRTRRQPGNGPVHRRRQWRTTILCGRTRPAGARIRLFVWGPPPIGCTADQTRSAGARESCIKDWRSNCW